MIDTSVAASLSEPATPTPSYASVVETHSGVIVLLDDRAYKFKKPVDLGFLDFRTIDARLDACEHEVELNRRLAPDVYLGVGELRCPGNSQSEPVVVMRRLPDERRLSTMIRHSDDVSGHLCKLARLLAAFHAEARRSESIAAQVTAAGLGGRWARHLDELRVAAVGLLPSDEINSIQELVDQYIAGRAHLFEERIGRGWVCEGHGDLLADDIFCLDDGPRVLDCLDFDEKLRSIDVLDDIAFLAMDLERLGRSDLAEQFLTRYDEFSNEVHPPSLRHHYIAYRASVRSKVAALRFRQDGDVRSAGVARHLAHMTLDHLEAGRVRLVLVGGLPGVGKSTVADALGRERNWTVLSSDIVRKELLGMAPQSPAAAAWKTGIYETGHTSATYGALLQRAAHALELGESVILDASWSEASVREMATDVARRTSADLVELQCVAESKVAMERIAKRYEAGGSASDATGQITRRMAEEADAWPSAHRIDTTYSVDESLAHVRSVIEELSRIQPLE